MGRPVHAITRALRKPSKIRLDAMRNCLTAAGHSAGSLRRRVSFFAPVWDSAVDPPTKRRILAELLASERIIFTARCFDRVGRRYGRRARRHRDRGNRLHRFWPQWPRITARAGGWGYLFGDEGGGFDIVRQALRAALRLEEGWGRATSLRAMLLEATGARDANALLHRFYTDRVPAAAHRRPGQVGRPSSGRGRPRSARNIGGGGPGTGANRRGRSAAIVPGRRSGSGQLRRRCFPERHHFEVIPRGSSRPRGTSGSLRPSTAPRPAHCWKPIELQGCGACCLAYQQKSHTSTNNKP